MRRRPSFRGAVAEQPVAQPVQFVDVAAALVVKCAAVATTTAAAAVAVTAAAAGLGLSDIGYVHYDHGFHSEQPELIVFGLDGATASPSHARQREQGDRFAVLEGVRHQTETEEKVGRCQADGLPVRG